MAREVFPRFILISLRRKGKHLDLPSPGFGGLSLERYKTPKHQDERMYTLGVVRGSINVPI